MAHPELEELDVLIVESLKPNTSGELRRSLIMTIEAELDDDGIYEAISTRYRGYIDRHGPFRTGTNNPAEYDQSIAVCQEVGAINLIHIYNIMRGTSK